MLCVVSVIAHSVYYDCQLRLRFEQFYIVRFHITFAPWWMCNILMTNYGSEMYDIPTSNKQIHIPKIWEIRMFTINLNLFEGIKIVLHATDCMLQMMVHLPVATATSDNAQKKKKEKRMKQRVEQNIYTCFCFGGLCVCFFLIMSVCSVLFMVVFPCASSTSTSLDMVYAGGIYSRFTVYFYFINKFKSESDFGWLGLRGTKSKIIHKILMLCITNISHCTDHDARRPQFESHDKIICETYAK